MRQAPEEVRHLVTSRSDLVALAGDWHGSAEWATSRLQSLGERGVSHLLHVGDFGIWPGPGGKRFLLNVESAASRFDMTVLVTPGNHEDWDRLDAKGAEDRGDGIGPVQWLTDHVAVVPRGHRWSMVGPSGVERSFVSLGGAPSIDFEYRSRGLDWWPSEMIEPWHVEKVIAEGVADVMVAHDAPGPPYAVPAVVDILASNPFGWSDAALAYAAVGRERMTQAYLGVQPRVFFHGHYHAHGRVEVALERGSGLVVCLDQQRSAYNVALLDLADLSVA